ncbi:MAG: hypothetical protein ACRYFY_01720 [Janthinobacterium lividum]
MTREERFAKTMTTIIQCRLDLVNAFEQGHSTPVYFQARQLLTDWTMVEGFYETPLLISDPEKAIYVHSHSNSTYAYGMVWVAADLEQWKVREALLVATEQFHHVSRADMGILHADHLFNKASVKGVNDAWLLIFPTVDEVNWKSGWRFERGLRVDPNAQLVQLQPFHFFKLLSNFWPMSRMEFERGMKIVAGQHLIPGLDASIRQAVGSKFQFQGVQTSLPRNLRHPMGIFAGSK